MKSRIPRLLKEFLKTKQEKKSKNKKEASPQETQGISADLSFNVKHIKQITGNSTDIVIRNFQIGDHVKKNLSIIYTDGLSNSAFIQEFILDTLMLKIRNSQLDPPVRTDDFFKVIKLHTLPIGDLKEISNLQDLFLHLLSGDAILLLDGCSKGLTLSSRKGPDRGVQEPSSQTVIRGPKEGFTESIRTNTALIRKRIKDPNLWLETRRIGKKTQTDVAIMYLNGVVNTKTVAELKKRLNKINTDSILESGYIEEFIQDEVYTPFPTVFNTERPDVVAAAILEGRIAILIDGTPFVLIVPALFIHFFQASEDYYQRTDIASLIRILRLISFFLALLTPSLYIAITTFHQEILPTQLLISLAEQREGVPFPAVIEAILMELTFEILREAGVRMPRAVGSAISVVGALVIGQAAVEAGIVSAAMVIIVALTAISSYVFPSHSMSNSIRILRFIFICLSASMGLFGIVLGLIIMVLHLNSLRSFGIPYLAPNAPFILQDQKDSIIRMPHWFLFSRPRLISQKDEERSDMSPPKPPKSVQRKEEG